MNAAETNVSKGKSIPYRNIFTKHFCQTVLILPNCIYGTVLIPLYVPDNSSGIACLPKKTRRILCKLGK